MATATATPTPTTSSSGKKGLPALVTPYNTSEFHAMVEAARAHHHAMHDQLVTIAAELRAALGRIQLRSGVPFGFDAKLAARKVTRPLAHAAALEEEVARAIVDSWRQYNGLYLNRPAQHKRGFDVDK